MTEPEILLSHQVNADSWVMPLSYTLERLGFCRTGYLGHHEQSVAFAKS